MRTYGYVATKFWTTRETQGLSVTAKLCAVYLMAGPHTSMLGCFRLPEGYISEDLGLDRDVIQQAFSELTTIGFMSRDIDSGWVFIHKFFDDNPIVNPNQAKNIARLFQEIPLNIIFMGNVIKNLLQHKKFFNKNFIEYLESLDNSLNFFDINLSDDKKTTSKGFQRSSESPSKPLFWSDNSVINKAPINSSVDNLSVIEELPSGKSDFLYSSSGEPLWPIHEGIARPFEGLSKDFRNQEQEQGQEQEQRQEQEQKQEKSKPMSSKLDVVLLDKKNNLKSGPENEGTGKNNIFQIKAIEVLNFLNDKTGKAYRPVDSNLKLIVARLKSGATPGQCRQVIAKKTREWLKSDKMAEYLRPATLFDATKFEQYVGELVLPAEGEA